MIAHAEKLEEELEILQESAYKSGMSEKKERPVEANSLKNELENLEENPEENFEIPDYFLKMKTLSSCNVRMSFKASPRTIGIYSVSSMMIEPKKGRKNPGEEYFTLVTQAIKLNSPYMDVICIISPKSLYESALKNDIPFHKWHIWIEKQLNASYLQTIYKKDSLKPR